MSFYYDLRGEKMEFPDAEDDVPESKNKAVVSKDPNVVSSQQEADDIAKGVIFFTIMALICPFSILCMYIITVCFDCLLVIYDILLFLYQTISHRRIT